MRAGHVFPIVLMLTVAACAAGPNTLVAATADAGFLKGVWHGCILPVALVVSFFNDNVSVYEVHNTGGWYDLGFFLGLTASLGGGAHSANRGVRRFRATPRST